MMSWCLSHQSDSKSLAPLPLIPLHRHPSFDATWTAPPSSGRSEFCYVDVHWSSGPANRAFWLMSKGLGCKGAQGKPAALGEWLRFGGLLGLSGECLGTCSLGGGW